MNMHHFPDQQSVRNVINVSQRLSTVQPALSMPAFIPPFLYRHPLWWFSGQVIVLLSPRMRVCAPATAATFQMEEKGKNACVSSVSWAHNVKPGLDIEGNLVVVFGSVAFVAGNQKEHPVWTVIID